MFGLMKSTACKAKASDKQAFRMHYCGTCKAIGTQYGHKARLLLNFDASFLAELLSAISHQSHEDWDNGIRAYRCFQLPSKEKALPASLQFAAAANLLLGELKVDDNIKDGNSRVWKGIQRLFSTSFHKANQHLQEWGFDTTTCKDWIVEQELREKKAVEAKGESTLHYFTEPTAQLTAKVFSWGASYVNQPDAIDLMYEIGWNLGELMYVLDAWEDYTSDTKKGKFNGIQAAFELKEARLPASTNEWIKTHLHRLEDKLTTLFSRLPIAIARQQAFISRLALNLSGRLYTRGSSCCEVEEEKNVEKRIWLRPHHVAATYLVLMVSLLAGQSFGAARMPGIATGASLWTTFAIGTSAFALLAGMGYALGAFGKRRKWRRRLRRMFRKYGDEPKKNRWICWVCGGCFAVCMGCCLCTLLSVNDPTCTPECDCNPDCDPDCQC